MVIPRATYRVQLNQEMTLRDVLVLVDHIEALGVSHLYLSPITKAVPGSSHGYDVTDYSKINPEIGSEEDLASLSVVLKGRGMGIVLDIVPNHMSIAHPSNLWWQDVLAKGVKSEHWNTFDISGDRVLLPLLEEPIEKAIEKGHLTKVGAKLFYFDHQFPLREVTEVVESLLAALELQHYKFLSKGEAKNQINYRRFFDINTLVGVRCENPKVFEAVHALPFRLIREGIVQGLRVDHIDGLLDPEKYIQDLRNGVGDEAYIILEKILVGDEQLRWNWPVQGTTGYDFLNLLNGLYLKEENQLPLEEIYRDFTSDCEDVASIKYESKLFVLNNSLASEVRIFTEKLPDPTLSEELKAIIAAFDVYRTYLPPTRYDEETFQRALVEAIHRNPKINPERYQALLNILKREPFALRFQQLTGPAMAKGYEDTTLYRTYSLASRNEVGSDLRHFGTTVAGFHSKNKERAAFFPHSMVATSTHDTKRGEEVRARMNVLSEIPEIWREVAVQWQSFVDLPLHVSYLFLQTLVGVWEDGEATDDFRDRMVAYMVKACKEAKLLTSWAEPDFAFEEHLENSVRDVLSNPEFVKRVSGFVETIEGAGYKNALSQMVIKLTVPGVPDIYQGCEEWSFCLVDPDNRRRVNYGAMREDHPKREMLAKILQFRRGHSRLFSEGDYIPLTVEGSHAHRVIAFARKWKDEVVIVAASRFHMEESWGDTTIEIPFERGVWNNILKGEKITSFKAEDLFVDGPAVVVFG